MCRRSVNVTVQASTSPPTLTFAATPTTVASGATTQLSWTSGNATSCTASGGWSGARPLSTTAWVVRIYANRTFTLSCTGAGGTIARSATVTVQTTTPAPTVVLNANPTTVNVGGNSVLTWSSTNATACTASGGWSGAKAVSGNQTITSIPSTTTYTLTCTGAGGSGNNSATVTVSGGGGGGSAVAGSVDSSYVDRYATNRVYVYQGDVQPDDVGSGGVEPVTTIAVNQDANSCTFGYAGTSIAAGTYTLAFTNDAAADAPGQNDNLTFVGRRVVTVGSSGVTSSFRPTGILTVGPGKQYATLRAAQLAAQNGAVIEIDAGTYTDDVTVWRQNNVTISRSRRPSAHRRQSAYSVRVGQ